MKKHLLFAIVGIGLAVIFGAFGAHYLKSVLSQNQLESFKTGVLYQILMCLGLLLITGHKHINDQIIKYPAMFLKWGILLFSGSIYMLTLKNINPSWYFLRFFGPITPIGGILLIISWLSLAYKIYIRKEKNTNN